MAERFKAHAWKACKRRKLLRGFKSLSLRHKDTEVCKSIDINDVKYTKNTYFM